MKTFVGSSKDTLFDESATKMLGRLEKAVCGVEEILTVTLRDLADRVSHPFKFRFAFQAAVLYELENWSPRTYYLTGGS